MDVQVVFNIAAFTVATLALIIVVGHKALIDRMFNQIQGILRAGIEGRSKHLELMKQISDIVDRTVQDIHKLYEALKVTAETLEEHNERLYMLEKQVDKLTEEVKRLVNEQANMKVTHM